MTDLINETIGVTEEEIKEAQRAYYKEWRAKNKDKIKERNSKYFAGYYSVHKKEIADKRKLKRYAGREDEHIATLNSKINTALEQINTNSRKIKTIEEKNTELSEKIKKWQSEIDLIEKGEV